MPEISYDNFLGFWIGDEKEVPYRGNKKGIFNIQRKAPVVLGLDLRTAKEPASFEWRRVPSFVIDGKSAKDVLPAVLARSKCPSCGSTNLGWADLVDGPVACHGCGGMFELAVITRDAGYPISLQWAARLEGKWAAGDEKAVIDRRPLLLSCEGAQATKAALQVARHCPLRALAPGQEIDDKGLAAIGDHPRLRVLRLWYCPKLTANGIAAAIEKLPTLEVLEINNNEVLDDASVTWLSGLKTLKRLILDQTKVGDGAVARIAELPNLEYLSLDWTQITDDGRAALAKHPGLRVVKTTPRT